VLIAVGYGPVLLTTVTESQRPNAMASVANFARFAFVPCLLILAAISPKVGDGKGRATERAKDPGAYWLRTGTTAVGAAVLAYMFA